MGYSLKSGQCIACQTANCQACNADNAAQCYSCKDGFYLSDSGSCAACDKSCTTCLTGKGCSSCASGYTKTLNSVETADGYECVPCNSPCKTCLNSPDSCTKCIDGYKFFGWQCMSQFNFGFGLTLGVVLT